MLTDENELSTCRVCISFRAIVALQHCFWVQSYLDRGSGYVGDAHGEEDWAYTQHLKCWLMHSLLDYNLQSVFASGNGQLAQN